MRVRRLIDDLVSDFNENRKRLRFCVDMILDLVKRQSVADLCVRAFAKLSRKLPAVLIGVGDFVDVAFKRQSLNEQFAVVSQAAQRGAKFEAGALQGRDRFYSKALIIGLSWAGVVRSWPDRCLLYTSPSPRDATLSRMPSSA